MTRLEKACEARGLRMNRQRRSILQVLDQANDHPSVEEIYLRTRQADRRISLATVYRTLNVLAAAGVLMRLELGDGKTRYEDAAHGPHEHLVDVTSGAVVEFRNPGLEQLIRHAAASLGYSLVAYRLEVFGASEAQDPADGGELSSPSPGNAAAKLSSNTHPWRKTHARP